MCSNLGIFDAPASTLAALRLLLVAVAGVDQVVAV